MYDKDGNLKPIEINTNVGWNGNKIEQDNESIDLTTLSNFITDNAFNKVVFIGSLSPLSSHLSDMCVSLAITYESHITNITEVTIPYVEDDETTLIIRSAYDTTALVDDTYCRDKVNFLNLIKNSQFGSQFAYLNDSNELVSNIITINDNGEHPNFILKARLPQYDKEVYPKFYKVSTQEELDTLISNVVTSNYFLMEFYFNPNELIQNHIKVFRGLNILFPPNLESISIGGYTKISDNSVTTTSTFNPTTFELLSDRNKYITSDYQLILPKLSDTDLVQMADDTFKIASELVVGDIIKTIDIPNPFNVENEDEMVNYKISLSELTLGTTYSTNEITHIKRINVYTTIVKLTFTDGSDWFDNKNSKYLSIRNDEVRFLALNVGDTNVNSLKVGDSILLLDTTNTTTPLYVLKEISNIETLNDFFGGFEITVQNAHLFLTKSDADANKLYVSIEHNNVDCYGIYNNCVQANCAKGWICCPSGGGMTCQTSCPACYAPD
jgi:hypothetical protein